MLGACSILRSLRSCKKEGRTNREPSTGADSPANVYMSRLSNPLQNTVLAVQLQDLVTFAIAACVGGQIAFGGNAEALYSELNLCKP